MLRIQTLVDNIGKEYEPMINQIKIAEFTKCISQLSGIPVEKVPDEMIEEYLTYWAKNKFRFFKMLGNKTRVDIPFKYVEENRDIRGELLQLGKEFPGFYPWVFLLSKNKTNKIDTNWSWRDEISVYIDDIIDVPVRTLSNMAVTTFFKRYLKAPDDLVTKMGRIYENEEIDATYTISIDPVDMMVASENPYNWTSCYRLELMEDSHADGCLAAVLDTTSLISYVWNNKGKYSLYDRYDLKEIRYYRMRQWLSISNNFTTIHFNMAYPGKSEYSEDLLKRYRTIVENLVAKAQFPDKENIWVKTKDASIGRENLYGYNEFSDSYMWALKGEQEEDIRPYNVEISCPCGCGSIMPGTDDSGDGLEYNGEGYTSENFEERHWCEYADDYCDCDDCTDCSLWNREHAMCELDTDEYCENSVEAEDNGNFDPNDGNIVFCGQHCEGCPLYKLHHPEEEEEEENDDDEEKEEANTSTQSNVDVEGFSNIADLLMTIEYENKERYYLSLNALTWQKIGESYGVFDPVTTADVCTWCGVPVKIDDDEENGHIILYKKLNVDLTFPSSVGSIAYSVKRMKL